MTALQRPRRREQYIAFFQPLVNTTSRDHRLHNRLNATGKSRERFSASHRGLRYEIGFFNRGALRHRVELFIERGDRASNEEILYQLRAQRQDIESALGESLHWQQDTDGRACRIFAARGGGIDDTDMHDEISEWLVDRLLKFKEVFGPRLAELAAQGVL